MTDRGGAGRSTFKSLPIDQLRKALERRFEAPGADGVHLDDRSFEAPETAIIELGRLDDAFRNNLNIVIEEYFSERPDPRKKHLGIRAFLETAQALSLTGTSPAIRAWLANERPYLEDRKRFGLASAALRALGATQWKSTESLTFWERILNNGPDLWVPIAFSCLRFASPSRAVTSLAAFLRAARRSKKSPATAVSTLWAQPEGKAAILAALPTAEWRDEVMSILNASLSPLARRELPATKTTRSIFGMRGRVLPAGRIGSLNDQSSLNHSP